jgi:hypothetical protein
VDEGPFDTMFVKLDTGRVDFTSTTDVSGILTIKKMFPGRETEFDFTDLSYTEIGTGLYARDIPADRLPRVFTPFFTTLNHEGHLGLGLYIAWSAVRKMGGRIDCAAPAEGGLAFTIVLPDCVGKPPTRADPSP